MNTKDFEATVQVYATEFLGHSLSPEQWRFVILLSALVETDLLEHQRNVQFLKAHLGMK